MKPKILTIRDFIIFPIMLSISIVGFVSYDFNFNIFCVFFIFTWHGKWMVDFCDAINYKILPLPFSRK